LAFIYATDSRVSSERAVIEEKIKRNAFQTNRERIEIELKASRWKRKLNNKTESRGLQFHLFNLRRVLDMVPKLPAEQLSH
jgi:hypothetical protein